MSHSTLSPSPLQLLLMASMLGLTACGGGGGGGGGSSAPSYTVTATAGAFGAISPASATVTEGKTTDFTVTPDAGYDIDTVTGCGGSLSGDTYTTGAITADCTVTATFTLPTLSVSNASVMEGDGLSGTLAFTIELSAPANGHATVDYAISDGTATTADSDYTPGSTATGTLTISPGTTRTKLTVTVFADRTAEPNENFVLTLSNASPNVTLGNATAYGIIADDDSWRGPLNDTGLTSCYDVNGTAGSCPNADYPGQDAEYGRDANAATNTAADGRAGFSFTKIDSTGTALGDQTVAYATTPWSCVLDNNTKLMWEVKTTSGTHSSKTTHYWYDSNAGTNGGDAGQAGTATTHPDTEAFIAAVNNAGTAFCGYRDWRLPTVEELMSIIDYSDTAPPMIDSGYFPNTDEVYYGFAAANTPANAKGFFWTVDFSDATTVPIAKTAGNWAVVRLVRGGQ